MGSDDDNFDDTDNDDTQDQEEQKDNGDLCAMVTKNKSTTNNIPGHLDRLLSKPKNQDTKLVKGQGPACGEPC